MSRKTRILILFSKDWDHVELAREPFASRFEFFYEGFEINRFPENVQLLTLDSERFADQMARKYRRIGIDGVMSCHEQFGALIAAVVAERMGLPGTSPAAIIRAQHKFYARQTLGRVMPEVNPQFCAFHFDLKSERDVGLPYPMFVKPIKATYSVLAKRVDSYAQLKQHLDFSSMEKLIIRRLVAPFNQLMRRYTDYDMSAEYIIGESLIEGVQMNVDGYAIKGEVKIIGCIDEVLHGNTIAFSRFEHPSRLSARLLARAYEIVAATVRALGFDYGFFNVELAWNPVTDRFTVIEMNPRMASQMANLYRMTTGFNPYAALIAMALGEAMPQISSDAPFKHAASFVYRVFPGEPLPVPPTAERLARMRAQFPDANLMLYFKRNSALAREFKWLGSYRYGVLNLGGDSRENLFARYRAISRLLGFEGLAENRQPADTHGGMREVIS